MSLKQIIDLFTPIKWETVWSAKCSMLHSNIFTGTEKITGYVILKVSKNKTKKKYQFYITNGVTKQDIDFSMVIHERPEIIPILKQNNIKY